ncbi:tetraacyldisaccharide 4'-kinase [Flavobacterium jejuense]|uniref:Tetraacyldisaccharide 4'-kinase n=1 Tax=Flavobacterium jejuense TaxID=1544455 RepID=A0ABX0IP44_9FLAO|nr:tetraacyldisaccharide 4'-kinase [Flavobacterium jejuense]NHN25341.1 tetraacyldisaccharide 4'-kinase [Flavobacterium jejuense]
MIFLRKILFPLSLPYWVITYLRNFLYDIGLFKSQSFSIPIIAVGNLSVGGTGKTPQIEYLIRLLKNYKVATLSRGYKRASKGYILANENTSEKDLGDEPFQFYTKFPEVLVAVDANRRNGITELLNHKPDVVLLDDAFQHRKVKAGFYILLTTYNDLFSDDYILPFGNLREPEMGKKRANLIIVTKCPNDLSDIAQMKIKQQLMVEVPVYFSTIVYDQYIYSKTNKIEINSFKEEKVLVAGIAKPDLFFDFLGNQSDEKITFPDHHDFSEDDIKKILVTANNRKIITTEKDYMRLDGKIPSSQLYYLPIQSRLIQNETNFNTKILDYVGKSTRNS